MNAGADGGNALQILFLLAGVTLIPALLFTVTGFTRILIVHGFIRSGQRVKLRYSAFPYQKFGQYEGTVASVSRSAISPAELSQQLAGLTSLYGANVPVYRITVTLASQAVRAYGEQVPLQPSDFDSEAQRLALLTPTAVTDGHGRVLGPWRPAAAGAMMPPARRLAAASLP